MFYTLNIYVHIKSLNGATMYWGNGAPAEYHSLTNKNPGVTNGLPLLELLASEVP